MQSEQSQTITHCNQCPKHCPITDLGCGRGKNFVRTMTQENDTTMNDTQETNHTHEKHSHMDVHKGHKHGHRCENGTHHGHGCGNGSHHGHGCHNKHNHAPEHMDELSALLGKCGHHLYHKPHKGRGQGRILKILAKHEQLTQKELQEYLDIQSGSMSEIISKLEDRGFVIREKDENDKRKVILKITEEGKQKAQHCSKEEKTKKLYGALSEEEQDTLKTLLKKLLDSWHNGCCHEKK